MCAYGCNGDGPCPRASGHPETSDGAVSDRTSSGLTSPTRWSPKRPSTPVISSSRSVRAAAPARSRSPGAASKSLRSNGPALGRTPAPRGTATSHHGGCMSCAATPSATGCPAAPSASWARCPSAPPRRCCATCSTTRTAACAGPTWSSSGRWRANGPRRPPRPCCRRRGRPGGPSGLGRRIPADSFRPVPSVDAGVLRVTRRTPPLLPEHMAGAYATFVRRQWN